MLMQCCAMKAAPTSLSQTKWWVQVMHQNQMQGMANSTKAALRPTKGKAALRPTKGMANPTMPISVTSRPSPTNQCRTHPIKAAPAGLSQTKWWV